MKPDPAQLDCFPNPHPGRPYLIEHDATEFTSMCPVTGQPDFGRVLIRYVAAGKCVELKSLKLYLQAFRNEGIYYEDVTNCILNDLVAVMAPTWLEVQTRWTPRGGLRSVVTVQHGDRPATA